MGTGIDAVPYFKEGADISASVWNQAVHLGGAATSVCLRGIMMTRRLFFAQGAVAAVGVLAFPPESGAVGASRFRRLPDALAATEKSSGGRLGVAVLDTGTGERSGYRTDERFAMCSTFKTLLVAAVLTRVDAGRTRLDESLAIPPRPLVGNSPLTEPYAGGEMTVSALCHAALTRSDNTAANVLLGLVGGPEAITRYARSLGDEVTRLDRTETSLNEAKPGDPRDTTSPRAMAGNLRTVLLGDVLRPRSREQLTAWMAANLTGLERLRAGLPAGWRAADKTGSDGEMTTNDIAVLWPAKGAPVVVTAYLTECPGEEAKRAGVLREVGRLVVGCVGG